MVAILIFWALALYGAMILVFQIVKRLRQKKSQQTHPASLVLIVQDAESEIEGLIRSLMMSSSLAERLSAIHIIDLSTGPETGRIVSRLAQLHSGLTYEQVDTESALAEKLKADCLDDTSVGYVYDLRVRGMSHEITKDIAAILD